MKKLITFLVAAVVLMISIGTRNSNFDSDTSQINADCIAIHPFELKDGVDQTEFENFMTKEILSLYNQVDGQSAYLIKGDRGLRTGKYAVLLSFDDVAKRNEIYPPEGGTSKEFQRVSEGKDASWEKLSDYVEGKIWDKHTDYFKIEVE